MTYRTKIQENLLYYGEYRLCDVPKEWEVSKCVGKKSG
jgi:hypothetical protein